MRARPAGAECAWVCQECGHRNPIIRVQCRVCGAYREFKASTS